MKKAKEYLRTMWYKFFTRKFIVPVEGTIKELKVWKVNPEANEIIESLGIQPEIRDKIMQYIIDAMKQHDCVVECMIYLSERVTHANEFAFAMYMLRVKVEEVQRPPFPGIFGMILGGKK
jgi:hypothetical protein